MIGADGPLALFAVGPDGSLGRMWQPAPNVGWSAWERIGVEVRSAPAAFQNIDGRIEVFAADADGRLGHSWQLRAGEMKEWSPWEVVGPPIELDPAVFPNADGRLEAFAIGPDGCLGHMWQLEPGGDGGWSEWDSFGQEIRSSPVVFRNAFDFLELFAIGADGCLGHAWQRRGMHGGTDWSDWGSFGQTIQSGPAVCRQADGRLEVFAIGADGCLGHLWQRQDPGGTTTWSYWGSFGHPIQSAPAVFRTVDGRLEVFATGADGCLGHIWQHSDPGGMITWSEWSSFGQAVVGTPAVCRNADGNLEVFALGPSGRLGHVYQWTVDGTTDWSQWEDLEPEISNERVVVCPSGALVGVELKPPMHLRRPPDPSPSPPRRARLSADVCVIGAGPAGITVADGLVRAGAEVVLIESGGWNEDPDAQALNHGDADGPIIKGHLKYLREGRRRQVQGSAAIWGLGWCMPFRSIDLEQRDWVPGSGWPLPGAELGPYEQRAAETFDFDPFDTPEFDGSLARIAYHFPTNPLVFRATLVALLTNPRITLELETTAVELNFRGDRIRSVRCARCNGGDLRVSAHTVVLAAGGVENARMLLLNDRALPVSSDATGRFFMEHPHVTVGRVWLPDPEPLRSYFYRDGDRAVDVLALSDEAQRDERLLNTMVQLWPRRQTAYGPMECEMYARAEQSPNPDSRVVLGPRLDRFGCPRPYLHWELRDDDWDRLVRTVELVASTLRERHGAGADVSIRRDEPWPMAPASPLESEGGAAWGNHHMGTTRMSLDPAAGVVDSDCRVHGTTNLYLAGSSVFPTGGCANPTFMIVALAHRLADHLAAVGAVPASQAARA